MRAADTRDVQAALRFASLHHGVFAVDARACARRQVLRLPSARCYARETAKPSARMGGQMRVRTRWGAGRAAIEWGAKARGPRLNAARACGTVRRDASFVRSKEGVLYAGGVFRAQDRDGIPTARVRGLLGGGPRYAHTHREWERVCARPRAQAQGAYVV